MKLTVVSNLETIEVKPSDNVTVKINASLPSDVMLLLSGKNSNDTIVDSSGKILEDKHVKLVAVEIDRLAIGKNFLQSWPISNNTRTSYFGFNESVILEFHEPTAFHFSLKNHS